MLTQNIAVVTAGEVRETPDEARERLASPAPVLISEQEVALGTAVALRAQPTTRRRWFEAIDVLRPPCSARLLRRPRSPSRCAATTRSVTRF